MLSAVVVAAINYILQRLMEKFVNWEKHFSISERVSSLMVGEEVRAACSG